LESKNGSYTCSKDELFNGKRSGRGVSLKNFKLSDHCVACKKGKQKKKSHPSKLLNSIDTPLERLHMDLFGPVNRASISGDWYCLVVKDDYSQYSWVLFMSLKDQTPGLVQNLITKIESLCKLKVRRIRSDNGTEFKNTVLDFFCIQKGIHREYNAPYVPQQNGVAERKNRTLIEAARTMLADSKLHASFGMKQ